MAADPHYSSTNLWLEGDGADESIVFTDSSGAPSAITRYGTPKISTTHSHRGGASMQFNGTSDYLNAPNGTDFAFGTGDFTVEAWIRLGVVDAIPRVVYDGRIGTGGSNNGISLGVFSGTLRCDTTVANVLTGGTLVANTWYHVALTRDSGTFRLWLDGVQVDTSVDVYNLTDGYSSIGGYNGVSFFGGYIDDLRVTKGVARYTAAFDPADIPYDLFGVNAVSPVPSLSTYFGARFATITAPTPAVFIGEAGHIAVDITAPTPVVFLGGGIQLHITAPATGLSFKASSSYGDNALFITSPTPNLSAYTGAWVAVTGPSPSLTCEATGTAFATFDIEAFAGELEASCTGSEIASFDIVSPRPSLVGYCGAVCSITSPAGAVQEFTGIGGGVATIAITAPLFELTCSATAQSHGSLLITAPAGRLVTGAQVYIIAPAGQLTAIGTATVVATYEAYAMNMRHTPRRDGLEPVDEVTHYTNFPFTHIVRYKNSYFGANSTGLYLLEGTTDDGADIDWAFKTGMTDFDSPQQKTVTYAYFGGRLGPDATVSIYPSEPTAHTYSYTTPRGQTAQNYRQQFGKGMKARYYAVGASGADTLELDTLDLTVATLSRRI